MRLLRLATVVHLSAVLLGGCMLFAKAPEPLAYSRTRLSVGGR